MQRGGQRHAVKVKRKVHADGLRRCRVNTSRLGLRDPRSPDGVTGRSTWCTEEQKYMEHEMMMKTASVKSSRKTMESSSRLPVRRECERLEGVETWRRPDTRRHRRWQVYRFGPQNRMEAGFMVWASKLAVWPDGGGGGHVAPLRILR